MHRNKLILAAALLVVTLVAYIPVLRGGFIWDDDTYVTENEAVRSTDGLKRIWTKPGATPQYDPLAFTAFWVQYHLWKLRPLGYHALNILLHAANAVLVWMTLRRLKISCAWVAALVFAVHPVNVATVAWVAEQKTTLSMLFYTAAILLYLQFDESNNWRWYGFSLAAFLLALLSKAAVVMLPVVLLGCAWWLHGRVRLKDFLRTLPYFALSLGVGLVAIWFENHAAGELPVRAGSFPARIATAGYNCWFYLYKALLPFNLAVIYPKWSVNPAAWISWIPGTMLVVCFCLFWWKRGGWGRPLLFGLGYFVAALLPLLGFFNVAFYSYSFVADHWQYYSIVAPIALAVAGWELIYRRMGDHGRYWETVAGVAVVGALAMATWSRADLYANAEALWADTAAKNPGAWAAHYNLGNLLLRAGRIQEAIGHYTQAVQIRPDYEEAHNNLAYAMLQAGDVTDAIKHLEQVVQINPNSAEAHFNLANALVQVGRTADAMGHYEQAVRSDPGFAEARYTLAIALAKQGRIDEAISQMQTALQLDPNSEQFRQTLERMKQLSGRTEAR